MRHCAMCHKGSRMGGERKLLRGHYNPVNWSRKYPNLQYAKVEGVRMLICTACIRTIHKAPHRKSVTAGQAASAAR